MGIEIPPPKGGPAVFTTSSPGNESPLALSPDEESLRTPEHGDDLNDEGSLCLSEGEVKDNTHINKKKSVYCSVNALFLLLDGTIDSQHRDGDDGTDVSITVPMANDVVLHYFSDITIEPN